MALPDRRNKLLWYKFQRNCPMLSAKARERRPSVSESWHNAEYSTWPHTMMPGYCTGFHGSPELMVDGNSTYWVLICRMPWILVSPCCSLYWWTMWNCNGWNEWPLFLSVYWTIYTVVFGWFKLGLLLQFIIFPLKTSDHQFTSTAALELKAASIPCLFSVGT